MFYTRQCICVSAALSIHKGGTLSLPPTCAGFWAAGDAQIIADAVVYDGDYYLYVFDYWQGAIDVVEGNTTITAYFKEEETS